MIYDFPPVSAPVRQGDIFFGIPRIDISLEQVSVIEGDSTIKRPWSAFIAPGTNLTAILPVTSVVAIVISQDCDTIHSPDITLCEIRAFADVEPSARETKEPSGWVKQITQQSRKNQKWFYLPPDARIGFTQKMGVDFRLVLRVPRAHLEPMMDLRKGRLNAIADEHFRERVSDFFRRYPYDEWYPLDRAEFEAYERNHRGTKPFPYQT